MTKTGSGERRQGERPAEEPYQGVSFAAGSLVDERFEALDARVRHKFSMRLPLTREERALLGKLPASKEMSPKEVQDGPDAQTR